jgi:hypothetical protein
MGIDWTKVLSGPAGGGIAEVGGGILSGLISAFAGDPYKKAFKWSEKARKAKIGDVTSLMKPNNPWVSLSKNLPAMNDAMNAQVNRGLSLYRGGAAGTEPTYPWVK